MKPIFALSLDKEAKNIIYSTAKILQLLNVKVTFSSLKHSLLSHPYYLSLFSISESLKKWKLETSALEISAEELDKISSPFITYLRAGRRFITVSEVKDDVVYYFDEYKGKHAFSRSDFLRSWDRIVLLVEAKKESGEPNYKTAVQREWIYQWRIPALLSILLLSALIKIAHVNTLTHTGIYFSALILSKFVGIIITAVLLLYEYDRGNVLVRQICSIGKRTNCSAVLSSSKAKIANLVSWGEIGFAYFFGGFLLLLVTGVSALNFLFCLNLCALPYIVFSIWYQALKIKQWCVLCVIVQALLLFELLSAVFLYHQMSVAIFSIFEGIPITSFIIFILPIFLWLLVKPLIYEFKTSKLLQYQFARFKNNQDVFYTILQKQPIAKGNSSGLGISIGNPNAKNILIKVCNPHCGPCAKIHPEIHELIYNNDNWKVQIIFSARIVENDLKYNTVRFLMAVAEKSETEGKEWLKQKVLSDWYDSTKENLERYEEFIKQYPVIDEIKKQEQAINEMNDWCEKNEIMATPTFFVNGYRLPDQYEISDLKHI